MYLARFLGVTLDTYQDTSGYMYPGLFITIHQDTPRYKITIHVSWTLPWCRTGYISGYIRIRVSWTLHHDTCTLDASSEPRWIHTRYARDTLQIHSGYMQDTCGINVSAVVRGYMKDTCETLTRYMMGYMYPKCILRGTYLRCRIMRDTCGIHVSPRVIKIHAGYIRDT